MPTLMKKANGERLVPDEKVPEFLEMGYSVIASDGKVLQEARPTTLAQYRNKVIELEQRLREVQTGFNAYVDEMCASMMAKEQRILELEKMLAEASLPDATINAPYSAEQAADTTNKNKNAPETATPEKPASGTKKRKAVSDDE